MSKRVSIVLPDEMPLSQTKSKIAQRPKTILKSAIKGASRSEVVPPVFVFVSPEISGSSEASTQLTTIASPSESSLNNWLRRESSDGGSLDVEADAAVGNCALVRTGSSNINLETSCSSIKQFLRNTVALVRAGESFTSVKHLFYDFIKSSSGRNSLSSPSEEELATRRVTEDSSSQLVRKENPYLSQSNDTLVSNNTQITTSSYPSTQMTTSTNRFNYPLKYDFSSRWLSEVSPLTSYTPNSTQMSSREAGYHSDVSQKSNAFVQAQSKSQDLVSIETQSKSQEVALASSATLPAEGGMSCSPSEKELSPDQPQGDEVKPSPGLPETATLVSDVWVSREIRGRGGSSSRSLQKILKRTSKSSPWRSPNMSPRRDAPIPAASEPAFVLASPPEANSQDGQSARSSGSSQRSSQGLVRQIAKKTPQVSPRTSVTSSISQKADEVLGEEPSSQIERASRSSDLQRSSQISRRVNFVFAIVSPEEGGPSQPEESADRNVEENSSCRTYQEECCCHHCQDMRRAVKRVEYFQSPEGQKRMESKLLAKNIFMDICALSMVRKEIQADLYGTRTHPPARVSYPVSICGASRLDGGSLTLNWFTHDLDCVDHFDFFVDGQPSKSVFNKTATSTVLIDVNACTTHHLKMRAVPVRGYGAEASPVDKLMSELVAGHMRNVRQGQLFASCIRCLDAEPQRSLVDFWTDSEFLYMPT